MPRAMEVEVDRSGRVRPISPGHRLPVGRALLTPLIAEADEAALLAEPALAADWLREEEDAAWAHCGGPAGPRKVNLKSAPLFRAEKPDRGLADEPRL